MDCDSVIHFFHLMLKGSKQAIPDDEGSTVVLVPVHAVCAMVNLVVIRRIQPRIDPLGEFPDHARVGDELVNEVRGNNRDDHFR